MSVPEAVRPDWWHCMSQSLYVLSSGLAITDITFIGYNKKLSGSHCLETTEGSNCRVKGLKPWYRSNLTIDVRFK